MASCVRTELTEVLERLLKLVLKLIRLILGAVIYVLGYVLAIAAIVAASVAVFLLLDWCVGPGVAMLGAIITFSAIAKMADWLSDR